MARIPEEVVERLKREVSLVRIAEASGVVLKRQGESLMGRCPFHEDRTPSFVITPEKNLWHCLGACQAGGSVIDFVMRKERCSFRLACELLSRDLPFLAAALETPRPRTTTAPLEEIAQPEEPDGVVLGRVVGFYHATLKESPEALTYLESRGLMHPELVDTFQLGFANRTLGYRLPPRQVKAGAAVRAQLQRLGVMRESGHEHFNGSLVIPIFDANGEVVEMYGRKITAGLRPGTPQHLYLPGPHRGVFNLGALSASREIIVCEALLDALTFWCAGIRHVTSAYGVEGFTKELGEALTTHGIEKVLIAYDADEAGNRAAEKLAPELAAAGMEVFRVRFPKGMDANEYARMVTPAAQSLDAALRGAEWMAGTRPVQVPEALSADEDVPPFAAEEEAAERREDAAAAPPLPSPAPSSPPPVGEVEVEVSDEQVSFRFGERRWRVRGLSKNLSHAQLKVNVLVARGAAFFVDQLELNSARQRAAFLGQAAKELEIEERVLKADLGRIFLKLEELQEQTIQKTLEPKVTKAVPEMSESERAEALALLRDPKLLERVVEDFDRASIVGEELNKLACYLAAVSRKLMEPLAIVIQSSSAAGKSSLMDAVLRFVPFEEQVAYAAMTAQALYYMGEADLQHKVLAIAEEQGARNTAYALKILQSAGELTIASTGKDPATGRLVTQEYRVTGPVMIFMTTTAIDVDEELLNRCLVITVDEGRAQTRAIHALQRARLSVTGAAEQDAKHRIYRLHQNAQRLLEPVRVVNPLAHKLTFPDHQTRMRRDHAKYLTLINTVALLHQHQRVRKEVVHEGHRLRYIEVTEQDIAVANRLAHHVLGRSLDELPPQTRRLLELVHDYACERADKEGLMLRDVRFTRREVRAFTSWGDTQLKVHLKRLEELEYVCVHRGKDGTRFVYELVYAGEGRDGKPFLPGLWEPLGHEYDRDRSGQEAERSDDGRGAVGAWSAGGRSEVESGTAEKTGTSDSSTQNGEKARSRNGLNGTSYMHAPSYAQRPE